MSRSSLKNTPSPRVSGERGLLRWVLITLVRKPGAEHVLSIRRTFRPYLLGKWAQRDGEVLFNVTTKLLGLLTNASNV